mmetsp:Transcript_15512/g.22686  ORF Transcript_15512/g.22686 Transcript_15512/m.22686 type:complete len:127 (+) Transcript_15512:466-846(+)
MWVVSFLINVIPQTIFSRGYTLHIEHFLQYDNHSRTDIYLEISFLVLFHTTNNRQSEIASQLDIQLLRYVPSAETPDVAASSEETVAKFDCGESGVIVADLMLFIVSCRSPNGASEEGGVEAIFKV